MFSLKYVKSIQFFLLFFLFISSKSFLVFPLNNLLHHNFSLINNSFDLESEDLLNYYLPNEMYTYIYIGSPKTKLYSFLDFENYGSYTDNSVCNLPSIYNNYTSSSFLSTSDYSISFSHFSNMCLAKETFYAYDYSTFLEQKNLKKLDNLTFLYGTTPKNDSLYFRLNSDRKITGFSCFHFGLQIPVSMNYYDSFIQQLKKNDYIETTYWAIEFNKSENDNNKNFFENDTYLIIGAPPHKYNPKKYNEKNFRSIVSQLRIKNYDDYRVNIWGIIFDKIFFKSNNETLNNSEIILQSIKVKFDFSINLIEGSNNYLNNIENEFFNSLYNKNICFKEKRSSEKNGIYLVIWCDKNYYEEIKKFPTLYFKSNELEYIFELNYEDLFMKRGNKLFFLIIFRTSQGMFSFGKLFFKKYSFTFSFDNKIIGFYSNNLVLNSPKINDKNGENNFGIKEKIIIFILSIVFIFVLLVFVIKIKKKFLNDRQKRMNELIDNNYVYMSNQAKNDYSSNEKNTAILEKNY